jgi:hypothetical protein
LSHIVTLTTQVRDPVAVTAACRRLGLAEPVEGTAQLYSAKGTGLLVQLPGWKYPVVVETATGTLAFDHFGGHWGSPAELDRFLQAYACEKVRLEAKKAGHTITEQELADGSVKLTLTGS